MILLYLPPPELHARPFSLLKFSRQQTSQLRRALLPPSPPQPCEPPPSLMQLSRQQPVPRRRAPTIYTATADTMTVSS